MFFRENEIFTVRDRKTKKKKKKFTSFFRPLRPGIKKLK